MAVTNTKMKCLEATKRVTYTGKGPRDWQTQPSLKHPVAEDSNLTAGNGFADGDSRWGDVLYAAYTAGGGNEPALVFLKNAEASPSTFSAGKKLQDATLAD